MALWFATHRLQGGGYDLAAGLPMSCRPASHYGSPEEIVDRLRGRGLSQRFLFPSSGEDPFKAHLERAGIATFL